MRPSCMQEIGNTLQKTGSNAPRSPVTVPRGPGVMTPPVSVSEIQGALRGRIWSFNRTAASPERVLVFLTDGSGELEWPDSISTLTSPVIQWLGIPAAARLRLDAGTTGYVATLSEAAIADIVGNRAESQTLAGIIDRSFLLSLAGEPDLTAELARCMDQLGAETAQSEGGSQLMVISWLRILFVSILRRVSDVRSAPAATRGEAPIILQRFRQLVELHFREQWPVGRYAKALGVSHDRLHAICTRELDKAPKVLIGERVAREAALHLARSMLTIKQISFALGFRDQAHFSNFFRLKTGHAPGRMRAMFEASRQQEIDGDELIGFADWP
jgi:AraC family transcriptional regulator, transcriptional activator of pobA